MRKFFSFILVALIMLLSMPAYSAVTTATMGDYNSSNVYRFTCDSDGICAFASDTGIRWPYRNYTSANTADTLTAAQTGTTTNDTGASTDGSCNTAGWGGSKHTLPTAVAGMSYSFSAGSKCYITVDVQSADVIDYSISGTLLDAGDSIKSTGQSGDTVTLFSPVAGHWSIKSMKGTWTDNGTN